MKKFFSFLIIIIVVIAAIIWFLPKDGEVPAPSAESEVEVTEEAATGDDEMTVRELIVENAGLIRQAGSAGIILSEQADWSARGKQAAAHIADGNFGLAAEILRGLNKDIGEALGTKE